MNGQVDFLKKCIAKNLLLAEIHIMLIRFALDPNCIASPNSDLVTTKGQHKTLLLLWRRFGTLITNGSIEKSTIIQAIDDLPYPIRQLWRAAISTQPLLTGPREWEGHLTDKESPSIKLLSEFCDLAVVEHEAAVGGFDMDENESTKIFPSLNSLEVCVFKAISESSKFEAASAIAFSSILANTPTQQVWDQRFRPLIENGPKNISVIDRYALINHYNRPQSQLSGLERFIRNIEHSRTSSKYINLYTTWPKERSRSQQDITHELQECLERNSKGIIRKFNLLILPDSDFGKASHGRFFRFGTSVWEIDVGLEVLAGAHVHRRAQASFKTTFDDPSITACEQALKLAARQIDII